MVAPGTSRHYLRDASSCTLSGKCENPGENTCCGTGFVTCQDSGDWLFTDCGTVNTCSQDASGDAICP
jgi:hypothetical protein